MAQGVAQTVETSLLEMEGVSKRFGATVALAGVSFSVRAGEVHALVGENGAGKSTLMKALSGALQPDSGRMRLGDTVYAPRNPLDARRAGVAMIYQELSLANHLTVEENILLGMEPHRRGFIRRREVRKRAVEALSHFEHPEIRPNIQVGRLSVAAKQLVEIARALAVGCRALVLDEPTSSLAQQDVERLFELIALLKKQGKAIVYISHFIEEVKRVADRVTVLRDGKVVGQSAIDAISSSEIVELMVGREVENLYPRSHRQAGEVVLEVTGLSGMEKPRAASLELRRGEILGIAGLVGAGRTELLRALFGLDAIRSGSVRLGVYSGAAAPRDRWQQGAGLVSENRKEEGLAMTMSVADNMTLSRLSGFGPCNMVMPRRQHRATRRWIHDLGIHCRGPGQRVSELSGGNQQKVAIGRLLQHGVDVLLLDEPTRGIDVAAKATIYQLIDALASGKKGTGNGGKAILMVSSYLPELLGICDRVAVMCRGRLGPARPVMETSETQLMLEATGQGHV